MGTADMKFVSPTGGGLADPGVAGLQLFLDFTERTKLFTDAARTTPVTADGNSILGVTDKSSAAKHFTESTNGPTYKLGTWNGKSSALFDNTDDRLSITNSTIATQPSTMFVVFKATTTGTNRVTDCLTAGSRNLIGYSAGAYQMYAGISLTGGTVNTNAHIIAAIFNGVNSKAYVDGGAATIATGDAGGGSWGSGVDSPAIGSDGGPVHMDGHLGVVMNYSGALSLANLNIVGNALASHFGLTWTAAS